MPHAMTEAFMVEETPAVAPATRPAAPSGQVKARQHESETPNERAMRKATAAHKNGEPKRQQG